MREPAPGIQLDEPLATHGRHTWSLISNLQPTDPFHSSSPCFIIVHLGSVAKQPVNSHASLGRTKFTPISPGSLTPEKQISGAAGVR